MIKPQEPPPIRRLPSRPETVRKREEILEAAVAIIGEKGYSAASLAEIGERAGVTHAGVRHHFGSKDNLLLEAVRHRDETDLGEFKEAHMPFGADLFRHLVNTAFKNAHRAGIVQSFIVLSAEAVTASSPIREYFETRYVMLRKELSDSFRAMCAEAGVESDEKVAHGAASILALMDGLQYQWTLDPTQLDLGEATAFGISAIATAVLGFDPLHQD